MTAQGDSSTNSMPSASTPPQTEADAGLMALVIDCIEGSLTPASCALLEARMVVDPAARNSYLDMLLLDSDLADEFSTAAIGGMVDQLSHATAESHSLTTNAIATACRGIFPRSMAGAILLTLMLGGLVGGVAVWMVSSLATASSSPQFQTLAEVTQTRFVISADAKRPVHKGRLVGRERLRLASGAAEVTFHNGATILLVGPAELELANDMQVYLHAGQAVVRIPEDVSGFQLDTSAAHVMALHSEFGIKVDDGLITDVQVYEGEVLATEKVKRASVQFPHAVTAGHAVRCNPQSQDDLLPIEYAERRFIRRLPPDRGIDLQEFTNDLREDARLLGRPRLESIEVTRAMRPVIADGLLDEWNQKGLFRRSRHDKPADREWIEGRMMFDDDNLYIGASIGDPHPMKNAIDPTLDANLAWRGGALQLFVSTDRAMGWPADGNAPGYYASRHLETSAIERARATNPRLSTLIMWHHLPSSTDNLYVAQPLTSSHGRLNPEGFRGACARNQDGLGYTLEYVIPWTVLGAADDRPRSGDNLATSWELHLSDESGKLWRDQIIEVRNQTEPARIFLFERAATWGRAEFR